MPASSLLLIAIGILSALALVIHIIVRHRSHRGASYHRELDRAPHDVQHAEWLKPSRSRDLSSASA